jgi:hypothetical protein
LNIFNIIQQDRLWVGWKHYDWCSRFVSEKFIGSHERTEIFRLPLNRVSLWISQNFFRDRSFSKMALLMSQNFLKGAEMALSLPRAIGTFS